jgi:hypothetical protein
MEGRYGPMSIDVELLIAMTEHLDDEKVAKIADAYREAGWPHARYSVIAAKQAGRHEEACVAMSDMVTSITLIGLANDYNPRDMDMVLWAARNAGYAMATEDLIGTLAYSSSEYGRLIDPWFAGFSGDH